MQFMILLLDPNPTLVLGEVANQALYTHQVPLPKLLTKK